jgi:beta-phosphoglucomutase-like phosphatase (HAD superfamily)
MGSRSQTTTELDQLEKDMKALEIAYEQYFMGIEQREPLAQRQRFKQKIQRLLTRHIPQVDLRFRLQGISSRFHSYAGHWDRILRLIDEGRYERHTSRIKRKQKYPEQPQAVALRDPVDNLYEQLTKAHRACGLQVPHKDQVVKFLARQQDMIRERFGERTVKFYVVTENGKPRIKARAKD